MVGGCIKRCQKRRYRSLDILICYLNLGVHLLGFSFVEYVERACDGFVAAIRAAISTLVLRIRCKFEDAQFLAKKSKAIYLNLHAI